MGLKNSSKSELPTYVAHMPVIPVPIDPEVDLEAFYADATEVTVATVSTGLGPGLQITLSGVDDVAAGGAELLATFNGCVHFVPEGARLPYVQPADGESENGDELKAPADMICLQAAFAKLFEEDFFPPGNPRPKWIVYKGVDHEAVRSALEVHASRLPADELLRPDGGGEATEEVSHETLVEEYMNHVMSGEVWVPVPAGSLIGTIALGDSEEDDEEVADSEEDGDEEDALPDRTFILHLVDVLGNVISPVSFLQGIPSYSGEEWKDHPLLAAIEEAKIISDLKIYVRFEVWDGNATTAPFYVPLQEGVQVDLLTEENGEETVVMEGVVGQKGTVLFIPDRDEVKNKSLGFVVRFDEEERDFGGHAMPAIWNTRGWEPVAGAKSEALKKYSGIPLGTADNPVVFRIGVDVHTRFSTPARDGDDEEDTGVSTPVSTPKGMPVSVHAWSGGGEEIGDDSMLEKTRVDRRGELHRILFDIKPGQHVGFRVYPEIEDPDINLPQARMRHVAFRDDAPWDVIDFPDISQPSIGSPDNPYIGEEGDEHLIKERKESVYILRTLRDFSIALFHLTGGDWKGVEDLRIFRWNPFGSVAFRKRIRLSGTHHFSRETIAHEFAHQVMWHELDQNSWRFIPRALFTRRIVMNHGVDMLATPQHALVDGWADFLGSLFYRGGTLEDAKARAYNFTWKESHPFNIIRKQRVQFEKGSTKVTRRSGSAWTRDDEGEQKPGPGIVWGTLHPGSDLTFPSYRIEAVNTADELELDRPYSGPSGESEIIIHTALRPHSIWKLGEKTPIVAPIAGPIFSKLKPEAPYIEFVETDEDDEVVLDESTRNRGESVEGNVSNAMFAIFRHHVLQSDRKWIVVEKRSGEVTDLEDNNWLQDNEVQQRFLERIWHPFKALRDLNNKDLTSGSFFRKVKENNGDWHRLHGELQRFNIAMDPPAVTSVEESEFKGDATLRIIGENFVGATIKLGEVNDPDADATAVGTWVLINDIEIDAAEIPVMSSTELEAIVPPDVSSPWNVAVITSAGKAFYTGGDDE